MSSAESSASDRVVTALRRPPVRQSTLVRAGVGHTFYTFVTNMRAWWPVQPFSAGKDRVRDITVEQRQGGRVYEIWDNGTEVDWGTLLTWQPPERFTMTWTGTPATTEVELTFAILGPEPDPGHGRAPRLGSTNRRATGHRLRTARRLQFRRLLPRLGHDPGPPGQAVASGISPAG
jgi:hypothetical protein